MKIGIAQINPHLGHFSYNYDKILKFCETAKKDNVDLLVFPEAALFGYHPMDLLERKSVVKAQEKYINKLVKTVPGKMSIILGAFTINPSKKGKPYFNSALLIKRNTKVREFRKSLLPTYDVFDESRHFEIGSVKNNILSFKHHKILITICEDIWAWERKDNSSPYLKNPLKEVSPKEVDLVVNLSGSPFTLDKKGERLYMVQKTVNHFKSPLIYANLVGAQDEMIYDGNSLVVNKHGKIKAQLKNFQEDYLSFQLDDLQKDRLSFKKTRDTELMDIKEALCLGLSDFVKKTGFNKVHLGLSGGVDSALVAALACESIGPKNVSCLFMKGPYSSQLSKKLAQAQCDSMECDYTEFSIEHIYQTFLDDLKKTFGDISFGITQENLQARLRANTLMAFSNMNFSLLLNTSNKSELAMGYSTLYGDQCGGLSVIGDLTKKQVYQLAQYYFEKKDWIPEAVITRAPSAELKPNQKDQDTLPPYEILDKIVEKTVENKSHVSSKNEIYNRVLIALMKSEFKRWQAPPILKVTSHAFGRGRRFPIAHKGYF